MISKRQFSIRMLLVLMTATYVAIVFRFELVDFICKWIYLSAIAGFIVSFLMSRYFEFKRSRYWLFAAVPLIGISLYACMAKYRIGSASQDSIFPRTFPYPDHLILQMEMFFRTPPEELPPNTIDIHGGMIETMAFIHCTAMLAATLAGWVFGLVSKRKTMS